MNDARRDWVLAHSPRPIRSLGLWSIRDWRLKAYSIAGKGASISPDMIEAAHNTAAGHFPSEAITSARYGVGFVICHEAAAFNTINLDWWEATNELRHRVFRAKPDAPFSFTDITTSDECACVWELRILAFERDAWLSAVISSSHPDLDAYLAAQLNETC